MLMKLQSMLSILIPLILISISSHAASIKKDGICYNILTEKTCEVTSDYSLYKGDIEIPDSVELNNIKYGVVSVGKFAFNNCYQMRSVTFPSTLQTIDQYAFYNCTGLNEIIIPASLDSLGTNAFAMCSGIWKFKVADGNKFFSTDEAGALFDKTKSVLHYYPGAKMESSYVVPATVLSIGNYAFFNSKWLSSVTLPNGLLSIGNNSFAICRQIKNITLPASLRSIGKDCFEFCYSLSEIVIPESVELIGEGVFKDCVGLKEIKVESKNAHYLDIGGNLYTKDRTAILAYPAASNNVLLKLPESVTSIGKGAFSGARLLNGITLPQNLKTIGKSAFSTCENLISISIPAGVKKIPEDCFWSCNNLSEVKIQDGTEYIGGMAFLFCSSLKSLQLPKTIVQIMGDAFDSSALESITLLNPEPPYLSDLSEAFNPTACTIYVPQGSYNAYRNAENWKEFSYIKEVTSTNIEDISIDLRIVSDNNNNITISGPIENKIIALYSITGTMITTRRATSNEITINAPNRGVYIIKVGNKAVKMKIS